MKKIPRSTICWSADIGKEELKVAVDQRALPEGTVIKLDQVFFEQYSKDWIAYCQQSGYPVFVDRKISEIPIKTMQIAELYLAYKPFMLNVMAGVCSTGVVNDLKEADALMKFAKACEQVGTKSCAVTVLTSKRNDLAAAEFSRSPKEQVEWYANLMRRCGVTDIVCSPLEAERLREIRELKTLSINTPGIRLPNTDTRDQSRITTPANALDFGANRLVIGSNLTDGEGEIVDRLKRNYARLEDHLAEKGYEFTY